MSSIYGIQPLKLPEIYAKQKDMKHSQKFNIDSIAEDIRNYCIPYGQIMN